jgi:hypothetical protein
MTPIGASHHQNWPVGVVRKDRSYADVFGIDNRHRPGGLFSYAKHFLYEKGIEQ